MSSLAENARRLLDVAPSSYVAERTRLVTEARAQGDKAGAKELAALAKPPLPLWAVLVAGRDELAVRRLYGATAELAKVQAGGAARPALSEATDARRRELEALVDAAVGALATFEPSAPSRRTEIRQIIEQLSRRADVADHWRSGVLRDMPADPLGFSAFADLDPPVRPSTGRDASAAPPLTTSTAPEQPAATIDEEARAAARLAAEAASARRRRAKTALDDAERRLAHADDRVDQALRAVQQAQAALARAELARTSAAERHASATHEVEAAEHDLA